MTAARATLEERQAEVDALARPECDRPALVPLLAEARETAERLRAEAKFADLDAKLTSAETAARGASADFEAAKEALSASKAPELSAQTAYDTTLRDVPEALRDGQALSRALRAAIHERDTLAAEHEAAIEGEKGTAVSLSAAERAASIAKDQLAKATEVLSTAQREFTDQLEQSGMDEETFRDAKADTDRRSELEDQIGG